MCQSNWTPCGIFGTGRALAGLAAGEEPDVRSDESGEGCLLVINDSNRDMYSRIVRIFLCDGMQLRLWRWRP
jgi:hypothetical protein